MTPRAVIFMSNALAAIGISHLLESHFSVASHIASSADEVSIAMQDGTDYIVTDAATYVTHLSLLLPHGRHTIVFSDSTALTTSGVTVIATSRGERHIVECLNTLLSPKPIHSHKASMLSSREVDGLRLVASGLINKEIATRLNISINTVLTHRKNITAKLGIKSVSGLTFYAMMHGIISPE